MPFAEFAARAFTVVSIRKNAPPASGLYGICNSREWLFIGEGSDIRADLLKHVSASNTDLSIQRPTGFVLELCAPQERTARHKKLIRELKPFFNR